MLRPWLKEQGFMAHGRGAAASHYFMCGGGKFLIPPAASDEFHSILAADLLAGVRHCISEVHTRPAFRLALDLDCRTRAPLPTAELLQFCAATHLAVRAFFFGGSSGSSSDGSSGGGGASAEVDGRTVLALNTAGARPQKDGSLLTGAHLVFPSIITDSATALACRAAVVAALAPLPAAHRLCNGLEAAVDAGVLLERAGLRLVGTYKDPASEGVYLPTHLLPPLEQVGSDAGDLAAAAAAVAAAAEEVEDASSDAAALAAWLQRTSLRVHGEGWELTCPASSLP